MPRPTPVITPEPKARLRVLNGKHEGEEVQLTDRHAYTIGRGRGSDVRLNERSVSRVHSRLEFDGTYFWLVDCDSANGTRVNEDLIHRYMLHDGDRIRVGRVSIEFQLAGAGHGPLGTR